MLKIDTPFLVNSYLDCPSLATEDIPTSLRHFTMPLVKTQNGNFLIVTARNAAKDFII